MEAATTANPEAWQAGTRGNRERAKEGGREAGGKEKGEEGMQGKQGEHREHQIEAAGERKGQVCNQSILSHFPLLSYPPSHLHPQPGRRGEAL